MSSKREFFKVASAAEGRIGNAVELDYHDLGGFNSLALHEGRRIGSLPPITLAVKVRAPTSADFDVVVNPLGWTIVSKRLGEAFCKAAGDHIELLPVEIRNLDGELVRNDFFVLNALCFVNALSEGRTVRSRITLGSIYPILKIGIVSSRVPDDVHVFRLVGNPHALLADSVLERAISKVSHDGLVLLPVEQEVEGP